MTTRKASVAAEPEAPAEQEFDPYAQRTEEETKAAEEPRNDEPSPGHQQGESVTPEEPEPVEPNPDEPAEPPA